MKPAFALLFLFSFLGSAQSVLPRRAPGFSLPDQKMQQRDLQDYKGKVVLLDFMRTNCPRCQALTKTLEQVKAKYADRIQILSVVPANGVDNMQTVSKYISTFNVSNPFLFDCGQMTASYLQITPQNPQIHLPRLIVVDQSGMIRGDLSESAAGGLTVENIGAALDPLLK